jgi:hypothetical protein
MLLPNFRAMRSRTSGPISVLPFSYRESWPWLTPRRRANSFCVMSKPLSSRRRLPTAFQSIVDFGEAMKKWIDARALAYIKYAHAHTHLALPSSLIPKAARRDKQEFTSSGRRVPPEQGGMRQ